MNCGAGMEWRFYSRAWVGAGCSVRPFVVKVSRGELGGRARASRGLRSPSRCWETQISFDRSPRPARFAQWRVLVPNACGIASGRSMLVPLEMPARNSGRKCLDMDSAACLDMDRTIHIWKEIAICRHLQSRMHHVVHRQSPSLRTRQSYVQPSCNCC